MIGILKTNSRKRDGGAIMFSPRKPDPFFVALLTIAELVQEAVHYADDFKVVNCRRFKRSKHSTKKI